jgi:FdhD protein
MTMHDIEREPTAHLRACKAVEITRVHEFVASTSTDFIATEEPLEIRLACGSGRDRTHRSVSITMRTPGHDAELAVGFLFTEGILAGPHQIAKVTSCGAGNAACVQLRPGSEVDWSRLQRHSYTTSSCGVCGKASLDAIKVPARWRCRPDFPNVDASTLCRLPEKLRAAQAAFELTGGLHASALFSAAGELLCLREDVGRHNALDKLIGYEVLADRMPLTDRILLVSGRISFELVQKAAVAGTPILAAIGAPSSLAVELAQEHGMTLIGFVRADRFNIYAGAERVEHGAIANREFTTQLAAT